MRLSVPAIEMYLDVPDIPLLQEFLNSEDEIAILARTHDANYAALKPVTLEPNAWYTLWHLPCGDVPEDCRDARGNIVADPWAKQHLGAIHLWMEVCPGRYWTFVPRSSGSGFDSAIFEDSSAIGRSGFQWLGNKYSILGKKANPVTERWWNRLRRWISRNGRRVASYGALHNQESGLQVWAFPGAYSAFSAGRPRSVNPVLRDGPGNTRVEIETMKVPKPA
jgi:hypothetical protein